ncbi:Yip1-domain-containing protein [Mycena latifolia]|nr:Yip1-domain-containing protein [Mycena latifolia]
MHVHVTPCARRTTMALTDCAQLFSGTTAQAEAAGQGHARPGWGMRIADRGAQSSGGFWTMEYYQSYFDVDTKTVHLYGPFWTATTLVLALFLSSSLGASVSSYLSAPGTPYAYDFGLLSAAAGLVYSYALALPVLLWAALRWMGVGEWGVVEAVAVWGYGMFMWIPVAILAVIPVPVVRWALVGIGFGLSGSFLVRNVYPILCTADSKSPRLLVLHLLALHAGFALSFKVLFFTTTVKAERQISDLAHSKKRGGIHDRDS